MRAAKFGLAVLTLFFSVNTSAFCGDTSEKWLRLGLWSKHHGKHALKQQNETHNQLGVDYGDCVAAYYKNSKGFDTLIAGKKSTWTAYQNSSVKINTGIMYGLAYSERYLGQSGLMIAPPILIAEIEINDQFSVEISHVGLIVDRNVVTAFGFRWKL